MATPKQNRSSSRTDFPKLENQPTFSFHIFLPFKSESRRPVDRVGSTVLTQELQCISLVQGCWRKKIEVLPLLIGEEKKEPQQLEHKPLPVELKYAFLEKNKQCPVVISSLLATSQEDNLLHLLKMNKQALGWKISDLKGISPTICTHHIYLEEESKAIR